MPCRRLIHSKAHPTQVLNERRCVWVWLRGAESERRIVLLGTIMTVVLGVPSPGCLSLAGMVTPAQCSPTLGEIVIAVSQVSRREEDHVIAIAKRHELQALKPDHCSERKRMFEVNHPEKWVEIDVVTQQAPTWRANCRRLDLGWP
jgi:hypothetical protein